MPLRKAKKSDTASIMLIEAEAQPHPWRANQFEVEFDTAWSTVVVVEEDKFMLGYIVYWETDVFQILNIAISKDARRRQYGTQLLMGVLKGASKLRKDVFLEVRENNQGAIAFYQKHGFKVIQTRINYYKEPKEDALVMRWLHE